MGEVEEEGAAAAVGGAGGENQPPNQELELGARSVAGASTAVADPASPEAFPGALENKLPPPNGPRILTGGADSRSLAILGDSAA